MEIYNDGKTKIEVAEAFKALLNDMDRGSGKPSEINITLDIGNEKDVLADKEKGAFKNPDALLLFAISNKTHGAQIGTYIHGSFNTVAMAKTIVDVFDGQMRGGLWVLQMELAKKLSGKSISNLPDMKELDILLKMLAEDESED